MNPLARQLHSIAEALDAQKGDPFREALAAHGGTLEDWALFLLIRNPEWTAQQLADAVGVNRSTLYDKAWPSVRNYLRARREAKRERFGKKWGE